MPASIKDLEREIFETERELEYAEAELAEELAHGDEEAQHDAEQVRDRIAADLNDLKWRYHYLLDKLEREQDFKRRIL